MKTTQHISYTQRLSGVQWKRFLGAQISYQWNLRRLQPGYTLDIGCGIGRNLLHLKGHGVGVDHNPHSIAMAQKMGLNAFSPEDFLERHKKHPVAFDSLLSAHVAEHMPRTQFKDLIQCYLPFLKPKGKLILICPQQKGFRSDPTHVLYYDLTLLKSITQELGFDVDRSYSFPFPEWMGKYFTHNEFVVLGVRH